MRVSLFALRFQLKALLSLAGLWVVPPFHFRVGFRLFVSPPRHDGSLREGFRDGCPRLSACVPLQFALFSSRPPAATLALRGRFLGGGCLS